MSEQQQQMTEEEAQVWVRDQFQSANRYLAERGLLSEQILTKESRYWAPNLAIWKFKLQNGKRVWVINGKVTTDHVSTEAAKTARDAMRYFSYQWQLKAQNIDALGDAADTTQKNLAALLVRNAEALYAVTEDERLWQHEQA